MAVVDHGTESLSAGVISTIVPSEVTPGSYVLRLRLADVIAGVFLEWAVAAAIADDATLTILDGDRIAPPPGITNPGLSFYPPGAYQSDPFHSEQELTIWLRSNAAIDVDWELDRL